MRSAKDYEPRTFCTPQTLLTPLSEVDQRIRELADRMNGTDEARKLTDELLRVIAGWEEANVNQDAGRAAD